VYGNFLEEYGGTLSLFFMGSIDALTSLRSAQNGVCVRSVPIFSAHPLWSKLTTFAPSVGLVMGAEAMDVDIPKLVELEEVRFSAPNCHPYFYIPYIRIRKYLFT
jgi:hypothetical protein